MDPRSGSPKGGGPNREKKCGPARRVGGPEGWEAQNFGLFFPSSTTSFALFLSLKGSSLGGV